MAAAVSTPASTAEGKIVASLIALMEAGTAPWRREWDGAGGGHHVNLISGRRYRGANPVLLTLGLHLRGIFPRRGSKAVHVLPGLLDRPRMQRESRRLRPPCGDPG